MLFVNLQTEMIINDVHELNESVDPIRFSLRQIEFGSIKQRNAPSLNQFISSTDSFLLRILIGTFRRWVEIVVFVGLNLIYLNLH